MAELRICGVRVCVGFSFLVFLTVMFLTESGRIIFDFFTVCLIHELGHAAAVCLTGGSISELVFCGMGIRMVPLRTRLFPLKSELFVLLAGPFVNLLVFAVLRLAGWSDSFAMMNLCAALFNLMPFQMLDGGSALSLLAENSSNERRFSAVLFALRLSLTAAALFAALKYGQDYFPLFCIAVFYFFSDIRVC